LYPDEKTNQYCRDNYGSNQVWKWRSYNTSETMDWKGSRGDFEEMTPLLVFMFLLGFHYGTVDWDTHSHLLNYSFVCPYHDKQMFCVGYDLALQWENSDQ
jgi:hypothetical protein